MDKKKLQLSMREPREQRARGGGEGDGSYDEGDEGEDGYSQPKSRGPRMKRGRGEERTKLKVRVGDKLAGTVNNLADFGAFITIAEGQDALLHHSKIGGDDWAKEVEIGKEMEVYVAEIKGNKINLSLTDPNEFQESVAEDLDTANVDYQWSDMMVALQTAGIEVTVPADEDAAAAAEEAAAVEAAAAADAEANAAEEAAAAEAKAADEAAAPAEEPAKEEAAPAEAALAEAAAEEAPAAEIKISAKDVKVLREATGAGMMDCKKALKANGGDIDAATDFLRKKGLAQADKKAGRIASEGAVATYVHAGSRIGVMIEVNCETDFVAR